MHRINRQACFDKEVNENRWKVSAYALSVWSLVRRKKYFEEIMEATQKKSYIFFHITC